MQHVNSGPNFMSDVNLMATQENETGSPESLGSTLSGTWLSARNFMAVHLAKNIEAPVSQPKS